MSAARGLGVLVGSAWLLGLGIAALQSVWALGRWEGMEHSELVRAGSPSEGIAAPPVAGARGPEVATRAWRLQAGPGDVRWVEYERVESDRQPVAESFVVVAAGAGEMDATAVPERNGTARWMAVVDPRVARRAVALRTGACVDVSIGLGSEVRVDVIADGDEVPLQGLLLGLDGAPLGPVGSGPLRLDLPFEGRVLVPGYLMGTLRVGARNVSARVLLCRAAYATGRLVGSRCGIDDVLVFAVSSEAGSGIARLRPDGEFELGPVAMGPGVFKLHSSRASLPGGGAPRVLVAGHQALGDLQVEPLATLNLALHREVESTLDPAYAVLWFVNSREARFGAGVAFSAVALRMSADGVAQLPGVVHGTMRGQVWTQSGWIGAIPDVQIPGTNTARVDLLPPGAAVIETAAKTALPFGTKVVISDESYGVSPRAVRALARGVAWPTRWMELDVPPSGRIEAEGLWAVRYQIELVAPESGVLASRRFEVRSREQSHVVVAPERHYGRLRVRSQCQESCRFALVGATTGLVGRWEIEPGAVRDLGFLPEGEFELHDLRGVAPDPGRSRTVTLTVGRHVEVVLRAAGFDGG